jgi:multidrug efflux pump
LLTLVFTPAMLALRIWMVSGAYGAAMALRAGGWTAEGRRIREDFRLRRSAKKLRGREISWEDADLIDSGAPK